MKWFTASLFLWVAAWAGAAQASPLAEARALEERGEFKAAAQQLSGALAAQSSSSPEHAELAFELDRLERIRKDYSLTKTTLFAALTNAVRDVTSDEFESWIAEGRFDTRIIDGERRFMGSSVSNLFFRYTGLEARRISARNRAEYERALLRTIRSIKQAAVAEGKPYVLPKRFHVTMTVTAETEAAPAGEVVRAWLPIPRTYPFQTDFKLRNSSARAKYIEPGTSAIRSVLLEQKARKDQPTQFSVEYDYTAAGVRFEVAANKVFRCNTNDPALQPYLREAPHVGFTSALKVLSFQIVGSETNDFRKARRCYDWIAANIKYSYALEYSTIRNISEYCRAHGYGDCGQEALLFITLCRLNGIPARWQSGWYTFPGGKTIHDWCEIYLAPYGWMPVDPYMGIWATRYARSLSQAEQAEVRDFYFGGLDQWRMAANCDHSQTLNPPKKSFRSDTVDFQRGELEWGGHNIYFDRFDYELQVREIPSR